MQRRIFLASLLAAAVAGAGTAFAGSVVDEVVAQLRDQGFTDIKISTTFLGRTRVLALGNNLRREIIINPRTGEILRDYWEQIDGEAEAPRLIDPNGNIGSGKDDNDDDNKSGSGDASSDSDSDDSDSNDGSGHGD
jgi:hypothetical protein